MTTKEKGRNRWHGATPDSKYVRIDSNDLFINARMRAYADEQFRQLDRHPARTCGECSKPFRKGQSARHFTLCRLADEGSGVVASLLCVDCLLRYRANGLDALPELVKYADQCSVTYYGQVGGKQ